MRFTDLLVSVAAQIYTRVKINMIYTFQNNRSAYFPACVSLNKEIYCSRILLGQTY